MKQEGKVGKESDATFMMSCNGQQAAIGVSSSGSGNELFDDDFLCDNGNDN